MSTSIRSKELQKQDLPIGGRIVLLAAIALAVVGGLTMVGTRGKGEVRSASNHLGFRCVKDARS